jgi:para-aminobenzoate synthetase component 1
MRSTVILEAPWRDPAEVLGALGARPWSLGLLTGGAEPGWSYVTAEPAATVRLEADDPRDPAEALARLAGPDQATVAGGPPFQGGVAGLLSYDAADRFEPIGLPRHDGWPDLAAARYEALLAFDHARAQTLAIGRGSGPEAAQARARTALAWLDLPVRRAAHAGATIDADCGATYERHVAEVVARIGAGEIFQANIARRWTGRLESGGDPLDLLARLQDRSPAPFAAYLQLADRAVVSNSPERFLQVRPEAGGLEARTQPIKGTTARGATPAEDAALAAALAASPKDRAENLMIVDLMRNDLSRVCAPGAVRTPELFRVATFANVHHLISTVTGRLAPGAGALDLMRAAFPAGSITGAPKIQAMKLIRDLEGARGPFFGSMFWLGSDGALDSSVLIRTVGLVRDARGWRFEARAGAGVTADSVPAAERAEADAKASAIRAALAGAPATRAEPCA